MLRYHTHSKKFSRKLRSNMTDAENVFWKFVRRKQLCNVQFYRQKPIGNYIVDFYAPAVKLVVEIDGGQHFFDEGLRRDKERDAYLSSHNLKVLRFDNWQVLKSLNDVLNEVYRYIESQFPEIQNPGEIPPF